MTRIVRRVPISVSVVCVFVGQTVAEVGLAYFGLRHKELCAMPCHAMPCASEVTEIIPRVAGLRGPRIRAILLVPHDPLMYLLNTPKKCILRRSICNNDKRKTEGLAHDVYCQFLLPSLSYYTQCCLQNDQSHGVG